MAQSLFKTAFTLKMDGRAVLRKIDRRNTEIMEKAGAFGRKTVRNKIRPQKSDRRATQALRSFTGNTKARGRVVGINTLNPGGKRQFEEVVVPVEGGGPVLAISYRSPHTGRHIYYKTPRPVSRNDAIQARNQLAYQRKVSEKGQPPRRGPTDLLRLGIQFDVEYSLFVWTTVIGVVPFVKQPPLIGAVSVPQLLEEGGYEKINGHWVKYDPHPYLDPSYKVVFKNMKRLTRQVPFR